MQSVPYTVLTSLRKNKNLIRGHDRKITPQLLRYAIAAGSGYLLAIAFYAGELEIGIWAYLALGVAFVLNGLYNFALIRIWVFPPSGRRARSDLARFCSVAALSLVVNYASFAALYSGIGLVATTAQRLSILIAAPITFFANRLWSFRPQSPDRVQLTDGSSSTSAKNESYSRM
jgi:putative flippase GtrA